MTQSSAVAGTKRVVMGVLLTAVAVALGAGGCKKEPPPPTPAEQLAAAAAALAQAGKKLEHPPAAESGEAMPPGAPPNAAAMAQAMKAMGQVMAGGRAVDPINFRELKALLPDSLSGLTRKEASGEKNGAMGMAFSEARARYQGDGGAEVDVKIVDAGTLSGPLGLGLVGWASVEVDRETETGYEKSTTISGHKAFEKYDNRDNDGELKVIVGNRFIVEVRGRKMKMDDIKAALGKVDLGKLDGMKNQGVKAAAATP